MCGVGLRSGGEAAVRQSRYDAPQGGEGMHWGRGGGFRVGGALDSSVDNA